MTEYAESDILEIEELQIPKTNPRHIWKPELGVAGSRLVYKFRDGSPFGKRS